MLNVNLTQASQNELQQDHSQHVPDLLVIGTQETFPEKTEWEVCEI